MILKAIAIGIIWGVFPVAYAHTNKIRYVCIGAFLCGVVAWL